jgi:putative FmdB family regulatory protein
MPVYEMWCRHCNKLFRVMVPLKYFGEKIRCRYCKKELKMEISAPYFVVH